MSSIFLIDQADDDRTILLRTITESGHAVTIVEECRKSMEFIGASQAKIVLVATGLHTCDASEIIRQVREGDIARGIVVLIDNSGRRDLLTVARHAGVNGILRKPVNPQLLLQMIRALGPQTRHRGSNEQD